MLFLIFAKKKKNVLDQKEILDMFAGEELSSEKLDYIYDFLENKKIDVMRMSMEEDTDSELFLEDDIEDLEAAGAISDVTYREGLEITNYDIDNFDERKVADSFHIDDDLRQTIEKIFDI